MKREQVKGINLPLPDGAYSKAIIAGGFVFTSGVGAIDPSGDLATQTLKTLDYLEAVLNKSGTSLRNAVKVNVYINDISKWDIFNSIYENYFKKFGIFLPTRTTIEANLPPGQCIEIDVVAVIDLEKSPS